MTTYVQSKNGVSGAGVTSFAQTYNSAVTSGNTLIAVAASSSTSITFSASDSVNGSWGATVFAPTGGGRSLSFSILPSTGSGTPTVTATSSSSCQIQLAILEVNAITGVVDQTASGSAGSGATSSSAGPTGTLVGNSDFALCATILGTVSATWAAGGSYTLIVPPSGSSGFGVSYFVVPTTAAQTATMTWATATGYLSGLITIPSGVPITGTDTLLGQGWV